MADQYKHFISTGSGHTIIELNLKDDSAFSCHVDSDWMGIGKHVFRLSGNYKVISPAYGWLLIDSLQTELPENESFDFSLIERKVVIVEYFKIEESPHLEHPSDLGDMQAMGYANWPDKFDFLLLIQNSDDAYLHSLYEDTEEERDAKLKTILEALLQLDRLKFYSEKAYPQ